MNSQYPLSQFNPPGFPGYADLKPTPEMMMFMNSVQQQLNAAAMVSSFSNNNSILNDSGFDTTTSPSSTSPQSTSPHYTDIHGPSSTSSSSSAYDITNLLATKSIDSIGKAPPLPSLFTPHSVNPYPPQPQQFLMPKNACQVCGDTSSGSHYGLQSCEGCKGFFRRGVQGNQTTKCEVPNCQFSFINCIMNKQLRTSCKPCRFKRCLEMGMMKDHVKEKRKPGGGGDVDTSSVQIQKKLETPEDIKKLYDVYTALLSSKHIKFTSKAQSFQLFQFFFVQSPLLIRPDHVFQGDQFQKICDGLNWIRAAFSEDDVEFLQGETREIMLKKLRNGITQYRLEENNMALISAIFIRTVLCLNAKETDLMCELFEQQISGNNGKRFIFNLIALGF